MLHMIPDDMEQVEEKLAWMKQNGYEQTTKQDVINDMTKDGVQDMLDTALGRHAGKKQANCLKFADLSATLSEL